MANVEFRNADGAVFSFEATTILEDATRRISAWADHNGFEQVVFWRSAEESHKLFVQLGNDKLNYWVPESLFTSGNQDVEAQLDYARGAQRRVAAGYGKFDS